MPAVRIEPSSARSKSGALATTPRELYIYSYTCYKQFCIPWCDITDQERLLQTPHRIESMNKAKKYSNLMPAVIAKRCNKLLIGKTCWKSAALPSILHGTEVIFLAKIHSRSTNSRKQCTRIHSECQKTYSY